MIDITQQKKAFARTTRLYGVPLPWDGPMIQVEGVATLKEYICRLWSCRAANNQEVL